MGQIKTIFEVDENDIFIKALRYELELRRIFVRLGITKDIKWVQMSYDTVTQKVMDYCHTL